MEGHSTKMISTSQNGQGHLKSEKLSHWRGALGEITSKCNMVFWMGS